MFVLLGRQCRAAGLCRLGNRLATIGAHLADVNRLFRLPPAKPAARKQLVPGGENFYTATNRPTQEDPRMSPQPTVVIADRSEAFLMYLAILLNRLEFEPLPVAGGKVAAKMVRAIRPQLLILGGELADGDPFRLLAELRGDASLDGLPIYFASANEIDRAPALAGGATGFLAKPISLETLHRILEETHHAPDRQRRSPRAPYPHQVTLDWNGQRLACPAVTLA